MAKIDNWGTADRGHELSRRQFVGGGLFLGIGATSLGAVLAACSSEQSANKPGQLTIAVPTTPSGLDPESSVGPTAAPVLQAMNLGLTAWRQIPAPGETGGWDVAWNAKDYVASTGPSLAESWTVSPDGKEYTFRLRAGVVSHYGNPLTSADVKWRWDRAFALNAIGSFFNSVMQLATPDSVQVVDQMTVRFTLAEATPNFLLSMNDTFRLFLVDSVEAKKHVTASDPWAKEWLGTHSAGYGPYKLESYEPGNEIVLSAFPNPVVTAPIGRLIFKVISDPGQALALLARGEVDVAMQLSPTQLDALKRTKGVRVWSFAGEGMASTTLVSDFAPLNDVRVRRALSYAAPYDAVVKDVYRGLAKPSYGPVVSQAPGADPAMFPYKTDYAKAKQLLAEAGHPNGFQTSLTYDSSDPVAEPVGVQLQTSFKQIGVDLQLKALPAAEASASLSGGKAPMGWFNLGADQPDPIYLLTLFFLSTSAVNWGHYKNAAVDSAILKAAGIQDFTQRIIASKDALRQVIDDAAWIWLAQPGYHVATRDNVTGVNWYGGDAVRWDLLSFQ